jgi:hypothetical protein
MDKLLTQRITQVYTAKIIRHRHKFHHYINDDLKEVKEDTHFKIVFSNPSEMDKFIKWIEKNGGQYNYNKEACKQEGKMPPSADNYFKDEVCWCDLMCFYLLHVAGYTYHSSIHPYKGEVYIKHAPYETE